MEHENNIFKILFYLFALIPEYVIEGGIISEMFDRFIIDPLSRIIDNDRQLCKVASPSLYSKIKVSFDFKFIPASTKERLSRTGFV